jgi:hypothetical protein
VKAGLSAPLKDYDKQYSGRIASNLWLSLIRCFTVLSQTRFLLVYTGELALTGCCRINGLASAP